MFFPAFLPNWKILEDGVLQYMDHIGSMIHWFVTAQGGFTSYQLASLLASIILGN
jgi:hypothetical protein